MQFVQFFLLHMVSSWRGWHFFNHTYIVQSSLAITLSPGGIFWDRVISEARYRFSRQVFFFFFLIFFFFFFLIFFFFFNLVNIFWLQIALSFMYFATMYFYHSLCLLYIYSYLFYWFIKRNQNRCPKQVGFCLCSASHCQRSMTVLAKQTTPISPLLFEERNQSRCPKQVGFCR